MKSDIVREIGSAEMLLPALVAEALAANDRIKVRMSALQAAAQHAREPDRPATDLSVECRSAGIAAAMLAALIGGARLAGEGRIVASHLPRLMSDISDDAATMIRAVSAGSKAEGDAANARLAALHSDLAATDDIELARISRLTSVAREGADSLHQLVMDLHKALNRLAAECAEDVIAGARVFGLRPEDRSAVESFMRGVDETRKLKFDHPGLETMATRAGERLLIQNDIGTTDAHVVVITVEGNAVSVTYTDVHLPRAKFFIALTDRFEVQWSGLDRHAAAGLGENGNFFLVTGRYAAQTESDRNAFLAALGASLVFLIDWNKARKLLRNWVAKDDAVRILEWAARHRIGHRAFLELGGTELLSAAVRGAASSRIGFGERLDDALGRNAAIDFLKSALRSSTEALRAGRSARLVRDQIEADLARRLERADSALLAIVLRQIALTHDIAAAISRHIATLRLGRPTEGQRLAARAGQIERKADQIAIEARAQAERLEAMPVIEQLVDCAEQTVDELEQAAFIASLASAIDEKCLAPLTELGAIAVRATEAAAAGLAAALEVPEGHRADAEDALAAVVRLIDAEHAADRQERAITALVLGGTCEVATSLAALELARAIERATDRLAEFGHLMRRHVMTDLSA